MTGKEREVTVALSSQTLSVLCFVLPIFPGVNNQFFKTIAFSLCLFFTLIALTSFSGTEIPLFEVFPTLVSRFGSNEHQSIIQANSKVHTLIFLIYF